MSTTQAKRLLTAALAALLPLVGCESSTGTYTQVSAGRALASTSAQTPSDGLPAPADPALVRRQAQERLQKHLHWAEQECRGRIKDSEARIDAFFIEAERGVPGFAEMALGWSSKWRLVVDYVPFTRHDRHQVFLREQFGERIFTAEQLAEAIERAAEDYLAAINDVENQMLVRMRADVADLPQYALPEFTSDELLQREFARALAEVRAEVARDLAGNVGCLVTAEVAAQIAMRIAERVLTSAAFRLGVSGGILTVGAQAGWATLGVGLVVGIIVDWIVGKVWDWYADPQGQLMESLNSNLGCLRAAIRDGDKKHPGLRQTLSGVAQQRDSLRRAALLKILEDKERD